MYVCSCFGITEQEVKQHADSGRCTPRQIASACKAGTDCGSCVKRIQGLLGRGAGCTTRDRLRPAAPEPAVAPVVPERPVPQPVLPGPVTPAPAAPGPLAPAAVAPEPTAPEPLAPAARPALPAPVAVPAPAPEPVAVPARTATPGPAALPVRRVDAA